jgi:UDPglucose 6-dehydrogenase
MNIGLIGRGFVGNAIYENIKTEHKVLVYDTNPALTTVDSIGKLCQNCPIIFVALPTPMQEEGECDLSIVFGAMEEINKNYNDNVIILKSTVVPGTCRKITKRFSQLRVVFSPEFLTEKNSILDFKNCNRVIFGGNKSDNDICHDFFKSIFPNKSYLKADWETAEMVKYFLNTFLATKVSFANEMYDICSTVGIQYEDVVDMALYDERVSKSHFMVPGPDGDRGFGGTCFPKDINALTSFCRQNHIDSTMLSSVWQKNLKVRQNKDWLSKVGRAVSEQKENKDALIESSSWSYNDGSTRVVTK